MQVTPEALFIVGAGRSGTTLLASIVGSHSDVALLPETSLLRRRLLGCWSTAMTETERSEILTDSRSDRWPDQDGLRRIVRRSTTGSECFVRLAGSLADGSSYYLEKDPRLLESAMLLSRSLPNAKFIEIRRKTPDVVASRIGADWSRSEGFAANVLKTLTSQELGKLVAARLGSDCYLQVAYEDLVQDPTAAITSIVRFLDLPDEPNLLERRAEAAQLLVSEDEMQWKARVLEPIRDRSGIGGQILTPRQLAMLGQDPHSPSGRAAYWVLRRLASGMAHVAVHAKN